MEYDRKEIYVYAGWYPSPKLMGTLYAECSRGKEAVSFAYDSGWLTEAVPAPLDPDLNLYQGRQYVPLNKTMFGIFADSCPDRWGRLLMKRREAIQAKKEERKPKKLTETDFLLGVYDESRMGALRFSLEKDGPFLSEDSELAVPPWTTLRRLEQSSLSFESDESGLNEIWLNQLLAPGSSLGGARPKANVRDTKNNLWIAKFPSKHDEYNIGAWEMVAHDLAHMCGLNVPEARLETFSGNGSTFLVKRFDRDGERRIHFASAMTLLGKTDGASGDDGSGYLDMASFLKANGSEPKEDLRELWKRIVFNMAVSNTDDHLRNHGFLLTEHGWRLSPLYDVNPVPYGDTLSLNVSADDNTISPELAVSAARYFCINEKEAREIAGSIQHTVCGHWERLAAKYGLSRAACEYMRPAFEIKRS